MQRILVVDDEKPTLSMFRLILNAYGYDVITAESGEEGLDFFERENPPIVLTDIKMPGMDGIELLKRIKEKNPLTEVIVITGHGDMDLAIRALNLDATDFINKPIQQKDLEGALKRAKERIRIAESKGQEITVRRQDGLAVIDIQGNITSRSEGHLREAFDKAGESSAVILNFNTNASVNGAGIAILTQHLVELQKKKIPRAIVGLSENFKKVFEIVGLQKLAEVFDSEQEAVAALKP